MVWPLPHGSSGGRAYRGGYGRTGSCSESRHRQEPATGRPFQRERDPELRCLLSGKASYAAGWTRESRADGELAEICFTDFGSVGIGHAVRWAWLGLATEGRSEPSSRKFPVNSLLFFEICGFWAEFEGFLEEFRKLPVIFPVISKISSRRRQRHATILTARYSAWAPSSCRTNESCWFGGPILHCKGNGRFPVDWSRPAKAPRKPSHAK